MKKILAIVIFLLLLSGCETGRIKNILNSMELDQEIGIYTIDIDYSIDNHPTLLLFGSGSKLEKDMLHELNNSNMSISLLNGKKNKIEFNTEDIVWDWSDSNLLEDGFSIRLTSEKLSQSNDIFFDRIKFTLDKEIIERTIKPIYLHIVSGEQNGISVMESPIAPKSQIVLGKEYSYSYKIFDSNHIITSDVKAELFYPEEVKDFIEIVRVDIKPDTYTEEQIKQEYKEKVEMKKLNGLKVYEVECTYILKKKGNVVFQPEIKLLFNNKEQSLAPFEPMCFFNFQST